MFGIPTKYASFSRPLLPRETTFHAWKRILLNLLFFPLKVRRGGGGCSPDPSSCTVPGLRSKRYSVHSYVINNLLPKLSPELFFSEVPPELRPDGSGAGGSDVAVVEEDDRQAYL